MNLWSVVIVLYTENEQRIEVMPASLHSGPGSHLWHHELPALQTETQLWTVHCKAPTLHLFISNTNTCLYIRSWKIPYLPSDCLNTCDPGNQQWATARRKESSAVVLKDQG